MKKAAYGDKNLIKSILCKSFDDNQSVNYIAKQDHLRTQRIDSLMDYSFETCYKFGEVFLSDDRNACALVLYPHQKKATFSSIYLDIQLLLNCIGVENMGKAMKRESSIKKIQPKVPMYYLWFIGVDPKAQGSGIGSNLMEAIIQDSQRKSLPIYLETSTLRNLPWYKKFEFDIYYELDLTYNLYFLKRDSKK